MSLFATTWAVQGALWALSAFSLTTWALVLFKGTQHWRLHVADRRFEQAFWRSANLETAVKLGHDHSAKWRLAQVGFSSLTNGAPSAASLEYSWDCQVRLERSLRRQIQQEKRTLESGLTLLASIGTTAPFVGLFGTVFGIMHALSTITKTGSASLDAVAGPIGETLVSTGIGIAVAVPAVLAYNFFLRRLKLGGAHLDDFALDFINLAQKHGFRLDATEDPRQEDIPVPRACAITQEAA